MMDWPGSGGAGLGEASPLEGTPRVRLLLYSGKGGVGKTSIAAATGLRLASMGRKTLVMSVDPAHSLVDAFDLDRRLVDHYKGKATPIEEHLDLQEIQVQEEVRHHWSDVYAYITAILSISGVEEVVAEELAIFPGMEEVCSLLYINQYQRDETYDVVILDCAPTGESLRFVSIPTTLDWYMSKVFKVERRLMKVVRPLMNQVSPVPLPGEDYFENVEYLFQRLNGVDALLRDPQVTSVRLVTNPEKMVLKETQRAFMYFCLYGLTVDALIVNRVLPPEGQGAFVENWRRLQEGYLAMIEEMFGAVPTWRAPFFEEEVLGREGLLRLGEALYGDMDPALLYATDPPIKFHKSGDGYCVSFRLPFVQGSDIELSASRDELIISIGAFRRHIAMPRHLAGRTPSGARRNGDLLEVYFRAFQV
jgi:arsenite-transporting ATPase